MSEQKMRIALDYDGTVTEERKGWSLFVQLFRNILGHEIKIVTFRAYDEVTTDLLDFAKANNLEIICTGRIAKHQFCIDIGWDPDVWIDDSPALIDHQDKEWTKEQVDAWRKTLSNRVVEEPEYTEDIRYIPPSVAGVDDF